MKKKEEKISVREKLNEFGKMQIENTFETPYGIYKIMIYHLGRMVYLVKDKNGKQVELHLLGKTID